jgi:hypothetical protein
MFIFSSFYKIHIYKMSNNLYCLTHQDKPCLLSFECSNMDSHTISNKIIEHFTNLDYHCIMPDYNVYDYLFCGDSNNIRCYLFKPDGCQTDEITVCLIPSVRDSSTYQIFSCLRDSFRCKANHSHKIANMSALDILLKYY